MTDRESFLAHLTAHPVDRAAQGAFADWLDEQGEVFCRGCLGGGYVPTDRDDNTCPGCGGSGRRTERALAHAFRWMSRRGFHPHHRERYYYASRPSRAVPKQYHWAWYPWGEHLGPMARIARATRFSCLPRVMYLAGGGMGYQRLFGSYLAAVENLAVALEHLRTSYLLDGVSP